MSKGLWLVGSQYDKLKVQEFSRIGISPNGRKARYWLCKCECGNVVEVLGSHLTTGHTRSCGCLNIELVRKRNRSNSRKRSPVSGLVCAFQTYRQRSKKNKRDFSLTIEHFQTLTSKECFYCQKIPMQLSKGKHGGTDYSYNGLDRKDNNKGYVYENVVPCCIICNKIKGNNLTFEEYLSVANHLKEFRKQKL